MLCPICQFENFAGDAVCANCGADLGGVGIPESPTAFSGRLLGARIADLQPAAPSLASVDDDIAGTLVRMRREGLDCLLVLEAGRLVGIFTDRDAIMKLAGRTATGTVRDWMTPDPVLLRSDEPIAMAIHKMAVGGFRHVPIVEDGDPVAVISAKDIFRHIVARLG
jgi:predicted transcriptional regulator